VKGYHIGILTASRQIRLFCVDLDSHEFPGRKPIRKLGGWSYYHKLVILAQFVRLQGNAFLIQVVGNPCLASQLDDASKTLTFAPLSEPAPDYLPIPTRDLAGAQRQALPTRSQPLTVSGSTVASGILRERCATWHPSIRQFPKTCKTRLPFSSSLGKGADNVNSKDHPSDLRASALSSTRRGTALVVQCLCTFSPQKQCIVSRHSTSALLSSGKSIVASVYKLECPSMLDNKKSKTSCSITPPETLSYLFL